MAQLLNNNIIKTSVPSHVSNSTHIIGSRPTGEQPGSGYTWGGGRTQPPINKPVGPAANRTPMATPVKTMNTPMDKATHPDRAPSLPFNNKIPGE